MKYFKCSYPPTSDYKHEQTQYIKRIDDQTGKEFYFSRTVLFQNKNSIAYSFSDGSVNMGMPRPTGDGVNEFIEITKEEYEIALSDFKKYLLQLEC